jgi:hypothetical protein
VNGSGTDILEAGRQALRTRISVFESDSDWRGVQAGNTPQVLVDGFFEHRAHSQDGLSALLEGKLADTGTVLCTMAKRRSISP